MDGDPALRPLLRRLDADLAEAFADATPVVLAFSGGLGSLIVAALARKHGDLACVVVGTRGAADVQAALVARSFLDYRVTVLAPQPGAVLRTARAIQRAHPRLEPAEVVSLVPLALVDARHPAARVLSGYGLSPHSAAVGRYLARSRCRAPGLGRIVPRRRALALARLLALPEGFCGGPRRVPAEGSGIGPVLRGMGHARHVSVARLVRDVI